MSQAEPAGKPQGVTDLTPEIRGRRIAVFAALPSFIHDILTYLSRENDVRFFERPTPERVDQMCSWSDVAWFEWCDELLVQASQRPRSCAVVCRLHSYEAFTEMPSQVRWENIDHIVFVNDSVRRLFERQVQCSTGTSVIFNGLDTERFAPPAEKRPTKKIGSAGYINYKKNPALLLHCFKLIHEYDPRYRLHIAGEFQDSRYQIYFEHFLNRHRLPVVFDGWVTDMPAWLADKDFVMSTSLFESFHYSIAEGMASGAAPLIHDWYGAENLYPREYLFADPTECLALLRRVEGLDRKTLIEQNRRWVIERFSAAEKHREIARLLHGVVERARAGEKVVV